MNMFDAIFSRKSIHHFLQEKLDWEVIEGILDFANGLPMLTNGTAVEFKLVSNIEKKQGFHGPFTIKAPYYICISSEEKEDYLINAGYLMQQLNLYIASKGLGSCFVAVLSPGYSLKASMKYKYVTALAFGKTSESLYRDSEEVKRLPENEVVFYKEEVTPDIRQILTAARLAPSLYNSQPWRFVVYKNRIHIFTRKNSILSPILDFNKMVDMGVMMSNFLLAAEELWVDVSLSKLNSIQNRQFHNNKYVCTVTIR